MNIQNKKIAIVCDWLTSMGGAEKVIQAIHELFPKAPIYTTLHNEKNISIFNNAKIITSNIQKIPFAKNNHQMFLPLMPYAFEKFNLNDYDIVISSSHSCAKGIITNSSTLHICYCHSPMRYAWENNINYINEYNMNAVFKKISPYFIHKIRMWDRLSADRVDEFIANSNVVKRRIKKYYKRESNVIYPFVDTEKNKIGNTEKEKNFYLAVGRLIPYKKFDLIVEAFNLNKKPIKIVGTGICEKDLKKSANKNIEFLGFIKDEELISLFQSAKALIFPQIEDLGMTVLEAMACGCPVIAYNKGGALETVVDKKTGLFFKEQTKESLIDAIEKFETLKFDKEIIRSHAENFSKEEFKIKFYNFVEQKYLEFYNKNI